MNEYRYLKNKEIIQEHDEVNAAPDVWRDDPIWEKARCVGQEAPDPKYTDHRIYRRKITNDVKLEPFPMNEVFYAIFGRIFYDKVFIGKIDHFNEGDPASVSFDYDKVVSSIKSGKKLLGFYHTHPNMDAYMSHTDICTMDSWVTSEGKELLCLINGNNGILTFDCYNDGHEIFHYPKLRCKIFTIGRYVLGWIYD